MYNIGGWMARPKSCSSGFRSRPSGGTWRVDLGPDLQSFPLQPVVANDPQHHANDFAGGVHLAADGNWLFVQEPLAERHHYLGYSNFDPQFASLSPNGKQVLTGGGSDLIVEDLERKLVQRIKLFRFEAKDVEAITTTKPIDFFPA